MKAFFETVWYFLVRYWVSLVLVAIGIAQMFFAHWLILVILLVVAVVIAIVETVKQ
jgi:hypothetical protein